MKVLIVGGNAAGMSAAARLARKGGGRVQVTVYEQSDVLSYGACGMPYYVGGFNDDLSLLVMRTPQEFAEQGIDVHLHHTVTHVDPAKKSVAGVQQDGNRFFDKGDVLLIATGARPICPDVPGIYLAGVHFLKTLADAAAMREALEKEECRRVAIIGGGYIGLELAEACLVRGKQVAVFEAAGRVLGNFAAPFGLAVQQVLEKHGAAVYTGVPVTEIQGDGKAEAVVCGGTRYEADLVLVAIGFRPNTAMVPQDIARLPNGALLADGMMRTNMEGVYAAGDCSTVVHGVTGQPAYIPLGTNANKQGRYVADAILGGGQPFTGALGTAMIRCMELELAKTGLSEEEAKAAGFDAATSSITANSHARYYPNPVPIDIRLCYEVGTKRLLGAQLCGAGETAWRIDVLACAIDRGMTAPELGRLDLGYAPPFASVWDAVSRAANAIK